MRAEPRRDSSRGPNGLELGELGVAVEAVAGLGLERRGAVPPHPAAVTLGRGEELCQAWRHVSPAPWRGSLRRCVQFLVRRPACAQGELVDAVAREAGVRVAVDESGNGGQATPVQLFDLALERRQLAHPPHRLDDPAPCKARRRATTSSTSRRAGPRSGEGCVPAGVASCARSRISSRVMRGWRANPARSRARRRVLPRSRRRRGASRPCPDRW